MVSCNPNQGRRDTYVLHPLCLSIGLELSGSSPPGLELSLVSLVDGLLLLLVDNAVIVSMARGECRVQNCDTGDTVPVLPVLNRDLCFAFHTVAKEDEQSVSNNDSAL
jgi:hypothetical protein